MTSGEYPRYFPLGDSAVTVEFGDHISERLNQLSIDLASVFEDRPFPGFIEAVPAYASATIFYDAVAVRKAFPHDRTAYEAVLNVMIAALGRRIERSAPVGDTVVIPVDFSAAAGLDLEFMAIYTNLTIEEVISIFTSTTYRVFMLGFLPGFPYMGEVEGRIAAPRKSAPRPSVPKGSVGIAGRQTGVYPFESPGGWQIIGRADAEMFRPDAANPCLLKPGDSVQFSRK